MSRSRKKPWNTISKAWTKFKEKAYRRRIKKACYDVKINFDPDADFDELTLSNKKLGSWGTKMGWAVPPDENDDTDWHERYKKCQRK